MYYWRSFLVFHRPKETIKTIVLYIRKYTESRFVLRYLCCVSSVYIRFSVSDILSGHRYLQKLVCTFHIVKTNQATMCSFSIFSKSAHTLISSIFFITKLTHPLQTCFIPYPFSNHLAYPGFSFFLETIKK